MMRVSLIFLTLLVCAVPLSAQQADVASLNSSISNAGLGVRPLSSPFSLLDASRITWSHSYSVCFFSGGNTSGSLGALNSTMFYEISPKLSLTINLGMLHNSGALWGNGDHSATLLPGFRLDYQPSENVHMSVSYQRYNGYLFPNYWRGYGRYISPFSPD